MKNNNEQFENFIRDFDTIKMTTTEKNEIRENLEFFASTYTPQPSPYFHYVSFFKKTLAVALIAVLSFSASKPASAKALPGELLYNVKIIHEKIEAAAITEPKKKVDFEIKRTETRIREAVELAETKKLDIKKQEKLAEDIKKHVEKISAEIKEIKAENPEQALALNSDLKTTLKVNSEALKEVTKKPARKKKSRKKTNPKEETIEETSTLIKTPTEETLPIDVEIEKTTTKELDLNIEQFVVLPENELDLSLETSDVTIIQEEDILLLENIEFMEKNTEFEIGSFADIILDSIEDDIEKTEIVDGIIKEEIVAEETAVDEETIAIEPAVEVVEVIQKIEDVEGAVINEIILEDKIVDEVLPEIDENFSNNNNLNLEISPEEEKLDGIEVEEITEQTQDIKPLENKLPKSQTSLEYTVELKAEVTSMEHILLAEENLQILLTELGQTRTDEKSEFIQILIENNQLGQAYIDIQNEIETLSELKLEREIGDELGITIESQLNTETLSQGPGTTNTPE